jgi:hypothetical protein
MENGKLVSVYRSLPLGRNGKLVSVYRCLPFRALPAACIFGSKSASALAGPEGQFEFDGNSIHD